MICSPDKSTKQSELTVRRFKFARCRAGGRNIRVVIDRWLRVAPFLAAAGSIAANRPFQFILERIVFACTVLGVSALDLTVASALSVLARPDRNARGGLGHLLPVTTRPNRESGVRGGAGVIH
ncbi:hypothetical protein MMAN_02110 [Mycobacterium mantenii]|uniref:Uncharacterized protein n=1 Tax=Mycobacterium mantenii TaxID=560555 RepID=A0ABM7JKU3_MYCNT|nr:hypothetical protein MMAN_02110 [Mycobacterium mantenii]